MLLFKVGVPHQFWKDKDKLHKITLNEVLAMKWQTRNELHKQMREIYDQSLKQVRLKKWTEDKDQYRISFGYYSGKSTKNFDLDNLGYLQKVWIDAFADFMAINDHFRKIVEVRTVYLGQAENECVIAQVEVINADEVPNVINVAETPTL